MSRSSSGSWSGAAPPGDIIDLDRFMRTARPSPTRDTHRSMVVDTGRRPRKLASTSGSSAQVAATAARDKRFSHDSGLSDGSYVPRRQRAHRPRTCVDNTSHRKADPPAKDSGDSLRAFRTVCERALLDQQQQIARVAQLCERLTERRPTTDTSEISSSSRSTSTRDQRRKDKHRADECKTYKIIMTKLDELNRLFVARARSPPQRPRRPETTSGSVSVSDKLVATEPQPTSPRNTNTSTVCDRGDERTRRIAVLRTVTPGPTLDIAPAKKTRNTPNVLTESVVKCDSSDGSTFSASRRSEFDLDNPAHFYAQAKRLQALHMTSYRSPRNVDTSRNSSLCALCRSYFRSLRQYLTNQLLCCPTEPCVC